MTRDRFLKYCEVGYDTLYPKEKKASALEKYKRHADGRHDGLLDLDPKDPAIFRAWIKGGAQGGHPWEIIRGGNSTHISLRKWGTVSFVL